jgi:hypothetical protein
MSAANYDAIVAALRDVPGVAEADVLPSSADDHLGTLHLGVAADYDEVAVATTVSRLLRERFGIGVDADRARLVTVGGAIDEPDTDAGATQRGAAFEPVRESGLAEHPEPVDAVGAHVFGGRDGNRAAIQRMQLVTSGLDATAEVGLAAGGVNVAGRASSAATHGGVHRAVASATLRAVEELVGGALRCELDHVAVTALGQERTVLVAVTMLTAGRAERLTGSAAVRDDVRQAVIRATLDAVNRRLEQLLS